MFESCDAAHTKFLVTQLRTPLGVYPRAVIRAGDVMYMEFPDESSKGEEEGEAKEVVVGDAGHT